MEPFKLIKKFAKDGKIKVKFHAFERASERKINFSRIRDYLSKGLILNAEDVEGVLDATKPNKYYCICKSFLTWITLILLLEKSRVVVITTYPSKRYEIQLYKHKKRLLHEMR